MNVLRMSYMVPLVTSNMCALSQAYTDGGPWNVTIKSCECGIGQSSAISQFKTLYILTIGLSVS